MEPHRVLQETAYPSLAYGLFGLGRFLQQIPDSYKRVIFMSICGSIWLSLDKRGHSMPSSSECRARCTLTGLICKACAALPMFPVPMNTEKISSFLRVILSSIIFSPKTVLMAFFWTTPLNSAQANCNR